MNVIARRCAAWLPVLTSCGLAEDLSRFSSESDDAGGDVAQGRDVDASVAEDRAELDAAQDPKPSEPDVAFDTGEDAPNLDAPDSAPCEDELVRCGQDCVDIQSSSDHCGGCGFACPGQCDRGVCQIDRITSSRGCHGLAITDDGRDAYVTSFITLDESHPEESGLYHVDLASGVARPIMTNTACATWVIIVDDWVYWSAQGSWPGGPQTCLTPGVWRTSRSGGATQPVEGVVFANPTVVEHADGFVYWADIIASGIYRAPVAGGSGQQVWGTPQVLCPVSFALYDGWIYFTEWGTDPATLSRLPMEASGSAMPEILHTFDPGWQRPWGLVPFSRSDGDGAVRTEIFVTYWEGTGFVQQTAGEWTWTPLGRISGYEGAGAILSNDVLYWAMRNAYDPAGGGGIYRHALGGFDTGVEIAHSNEPVVVARRGSLLYWCSSRDGLLRMPVSD